MKKILFVCHGNICRSPMAEYIFKNIDHHHQFHVESRATTTDAIGGDIYPPIKEVLEKNHISYQKHQARQITSYDYDWFDYIFCMDQENLDDLERILPKMNKTFLLGEKEIEDPWYSRDFDSCFKEVYFSCSKLFDELNTKK